uniref:Uncharacterized protein n=1 Tax=Romanomermis culicivorax TaxID=13658 RepID=A0A915JDW9_ROMCU
MVSTILVEYWWILLQIFTVSLYKNEQPKIDMIMIKQTVDCLLDNTELRSLIMKHYRRPRGLLSFGQWEKFDGFTSNKQEE